MRRLRALMRKELTHMRRDPRTMMFAVVMPILQLFLLGYATNTDVKNVPTAIFNQDNTPASRDLLATYQATGYFLFEYVAFSDSELNNLIAGGQARVGIIIPPGYGNDLAAGRPAEVVVLIDGSDATIAGTALSTATLVGQAHATDIRLQQLSARGPVSAGLSPLNVHTRVLYNPNLESSYSMIPGLIAMLLMMTATMLTSFAIVREREHGTIEQLIVTPIRNWELVVAKIIPYIFISMLNVVLVLAVGTFWFGVPIRGSIMLLLALTGLYLLPNLGIGLVISTFARTQQEAMFLVMPIMMPSMMLSGFIFPVAALPMALQIVSRFLPLTYFIFVARSIVVKGAGLELLIPQVIVLTVFALAMMVIAAVRFHKTLD